MILVNIVHDYTEYLYARMFNEDLAERGISLSENSMDEVEWDLLIIFHSKSKGSFSYKRIVFLGGEPSEAYHNKRLMNFCNVIISVKFNWTGFWQSYNDWHLFKDYDTRESTLSLKSIRQMSVQCFKRDMAITMINSGVVSLPGHVVRNRLQEKIEATYGVSVQMFGGGNKFKLKSDVLCNSRYSIIIENSTKGRFWTEKWSDAILAGCVPIYYGSSYINEVFPDLKAVCFSKGQEHQFMKTIGAAVNDELPYDILFEGVLSARRLILKKYTIVPLIDDLLKLRVTSGCIELGKFSRSRMNLWRVKNRFLIFWKTLTFQL